MVLAALNPDITANLASRQEWRKRVHDAAYKSPGGTRITFDFVAVARETTKRTVLFEFPEINDGYVQDNGFGARRYPMLCYFSGPQHDLIATAFEAALLEKGPGTLEHPFYGTFQVNPFGDVIRRNDLVNEANLSIVETMFMTSTGLVYPSALKSARNEILVAIALFDVAAAQKFEAAADLRKKTSQVNAAARIRKWLQNVQSSIGKVAGAVSKVNRDFRTTQALINYGLDTLIGTPLLLARQVNNLITAPARANVGLQSRLDGYHALATSIMTSTVVAPTQLIAGLVTESERLKRSNDFHAADLFVTTAVIGSALSALENTYTTRAEARATALDLLEQLDDVIAWREERFEGLDQVDTGETHQALQNALGLVAGYLIESSDSLSGSASRAVSDEPGTTGVVLQSGNLATAPAAILASGRELVEHRMIVDRPRTVIDLCAELYLDVSDDILDFLINTNDLTGSEILELPRGRTIVFYA